MNNQIEMSMTNESEDDNPLFRKVALRHPDSFGLDERPTVSLHLLVKNGESCIGRLLKNVGPYINEIVAIVNDCTDRTIAILREYAEFRGSNFGLQIIEVTPCTNPELYILDVPETYAAGTPLEGETLPGPFSGEPLLADWAGIRNLGWGRCTKQWILFLDVDDVIQDPEAIPGLCWALDGNRLNSDGTVVVDERLKGDLAVSRYIFGATETGASQSDAFRERICRNAPFISWAGVAHEVLRGARKTAQIDGNLVVRDMRDSTGDKIRVPGRCLKILYHHARSNDWVVSPRDLIYLGMEARSTMPDFALAVLERYLTMSLWPEERAWACSMIGEICEHHDDYPLASIWYEKALAEHPGSKAAFRLCRSRFHEAKWQKAVDAYHVGVENQHGVLQIIDNGPAYEDMSKILVAAALDKLGCRAAALAMCEEALKSFPQNPALITMVNQMRAKI